MNEEQAEREALTPGTFKAECEGMEKKLALLRDAVIGLSKRLEPILMGGPVEIEEKTETLVPARTQVNAMISCWTDNLGETLRRVQALDAAIDL